MAKFNKFFFDKSSSRVNSEAARAHASSEPGSMHHYRISDLLSLILPENWSDELIYPDLPYEVRHTVRKRFSENEFLSQDTGIVGSKRASFASSSLVSSVLNSPPSLLRLKLSVKTQTKTSTESGSREGFFGHFLGDVGSFIDDVG